MDAQTTLLGLMPLVTMRIAHRLGDWPACHREDVEQDVALKLFKVVSNPERLARIEKLEAYAQTSIDHAINDAIRAHARDRHMVLLDHETDATHSPAVNDDPAENSIDAEIAAGLTLAPGQRRLFDLRRKLGSTAAVAEALDISVQTASERISRLVRTIREQRHGTAA